MVAMRGKDPNKVKTAIVSQLRLSKHRLLFKPCPGHHSYGTRSHGHALTRADLQRPYPRSPTRIMKSLETSRANRKSFWNLERPITYHSDSSDHETLFPVSINSPASPSGDILADRENVVNPDNEDNIPTIK